MLVRTSLLVACMIAVPGWAVCSHHLPAEVRAAARCGIWQPVAARFESWFSSAAEPRVTEPAETPISWDGAAADSPPAAVADEPAASVTDRLAALGAVAVDCRPLEAGSEMHVASCRVAMDAAGQLHRVFQAAGPSPKAATAALAAQVEAWRERLTLRAGSPATHSPDSPP